MEQRIGPKILPENAAGLDPAFVPGLTFPLPGPAAEAVAEPAAETPPAETPPAGPEAPETSQPVPDVAEDAADDTVEPETAETADEPEAGGPVFDVADRRASIAAGRTGVTFRLDDETAEFDWDEIGAVEIDTPRFTRRFSVTVHTTGHRQYDMDVEAPDKARLAQWTAEFDAVLDAYFEGTGS